MKKAFKLFVLFCLALVVGFFILKTSRNIGVNYESTILTSTHFQISYKGIYVSEAEEIRRTLESNYDRIQSELEAPQSETIRVFIHPNQKEFNNATGLFGKANGTSRGPLEFHLLWTNWFNSIFPDDPAKTAIHEFTHCVQLNILINDAKTSMTYSDEASFNNLFEEKFDADYPQCLWETICLYQAKEVNTLSVKYAMRNKLTLKDLNSSNQIYNVGYTIIECMVDKWGKAKIPEFIRSYGDFEKVLGVSEAEFEELWQKFVEEEY